MLRRYILEISSGRSVRRISPRITTQIPLYLSSRKEFSVASQSNSPKGSGSTGKPPASGSNLSKVFIGSIALGAAAITAYQTGYLDKYLTKEQHNDLDTHPTPIVQEEPHQSKTVNEDLHDGENVEQVAVQNVEEPKVAVPTVERGEKSIETDPYYYRREEETQSEIKELPTLREEARSEIKELPTLSEEEAQPEIKELPTFQPEDTISDNEGKLPSSDHSISTSDHANIDSVATSQEDIDTKEEDLKPISEHHNQVQTTTTPMEVAPVIEEDERTPEQSHQLGTTSIQEDTLSNGIKEPDSLLDEYLLRNKHEQTVADFLHLDKEIAEAVKGTDDVYMSNDGKVVLDFLQAIHTAEQRQADLDARIFSEEKRLMKEKYEKELKDARARELMYAERETILDKELHKEKVKAAAALKALQEKLEEEFKMEIERKDSETELELKKLKDLSKAELIAAIAREKASQIEKMEEANLNINALCMAFYARSEEARQSHSVHKLALGALALEDALSKGLPIQKEMDALNSYIDGIDKDSLLGLVMASLPEDTLKNGIDTILQLNQKFDGLKGTLRHFSLMPPGGGGILAHSLAYIASLLKVKEADQSGDGIESLINRVERFLADGNLLEAAETLEHGLKGSQAAEVVDDWVRQARNRAITEQALTLLQSYATSVSLS